MKCAKRSLGDFIRDALPPEVNLYGRMFDGGCGCTECVIHELLEAGLDAEFDPSYGIIVHCETHSDEEPCAITCPIRSRADEIIVPRWRP